MNKIRFFLIAFVSAFIFTARPATAQTLLDPDELKQAKTFFSLDEARTQPDSVLKLSLRGKKLKEFPNEIFSFLNLQVLNLSKNNIKEIPANIGKLKMLQELDMSNNKLTNLPVQIGQLSNLSKLKLNRNEITSLPEEISGLVNLEMLEMWDNELDTVPDEIKNLTHLKVFELRGILFSDDEQKRIHSLLPETRIYFSPSCSCKE